mgnify:CR=1 FL=1
MELLVATGLYYLFNNNARQYGRGEKYDQLIRIASIIRSKKTVPEPDEVYDDNDFPPSEFNNDAAIIEAIEYELDEFITGIKQNIGEDEEVKELIQLFKNHIYEGGKLNIDKFITILENSNEKGDYINYEGFYFYILKLPKPKYRDYMVSDTKDRLLVKGKNGSVVSIILKKESWHAEENGRGYHNIKKKFISNARLAKLYARNPNLKSGKRAPKGYTRNMLCWALQYLVHNGRLSGNSVIALEADGTDGDRLVKMYEGMGFKFISADKETEEDFPGEAGGLMTARLAKILRWCSTTYGATSFDERATPAQNSTS